MDGHVERVAVVEAEAVVRRRLSERADRQRAMEALGEEALDARDLGERPVRVGRGSVVASASP